MKVGRWMLVWFIISLISIAFGQLSERFWPQSDSSIASEWQDSNDGPEEPETLRGWPIDQDEGLCSKQVVLDCCARQRESSKDARGCHLSERTQTVCSDWILMFCCGRSRAATRRTGSRHWHGRRSSYRQCWRQIQVAMRYDNPLPSDCCQMWSFYRVCRRYYAYGHGNNKTLESRPPETRPPARPPTVRPSKLPARPPGATSRPRPPTPGPPTGPGGFPSWPVPTRPWASSVPPGLWEPWPVSRAPRTTRRPTKGTTRSPPTTTTEPPTTTSLAPEVEASSEPEPESEPDYSEFPWVAPNPTLPPYAPWPPKRTYESPLKRPSNNIADNDNK